MFRRRKTWWLSASLMVGWFLLRDDKCQYGLCSHIPSSIYWETPIGIKPLSIGSRVGRPTDRNALNTAFGKIDHPYPKNYSALLRLAWHTLYLELQSSPFRSFLDSLTEKVHLSTCHFRLIKNRRRLESSFVFSQLLKIEKTSCVKVSKIHLI